MTDDAINEYIINESCNSKKSSNSSFFQSDVYTLKEDGTSSKACVTSPLAGDHNKMRERFLSRLTDEKVWLTPENKPKAHQSVVIFDWDDTLLCTSYLLPSTFGATPACLLSQTKEKLEKLEKKVIKIIKMCLTKAQVFIITNSVKGWVEESCQHYLPNLYPLLKKVKIISARSKYENKFPTKVDQWKLHAFLETKKNLEKGAITNIIAIGDSQIELDAAQNLSEEFPLARIKTVKLKSNPTPDELDKELKALILKIDMIINNGNDMSIKLERSNPKHLKASKINSTPANLRLTKVIS